MDVVGWTLTDPSVEAELSVALETRSEATRNMLVTVVEGKVTVSDIM